MLKYSAMFLGSMILASIIIACTAPAPVPAPAPAPSNAVAVPTSGPSGRCQRSISNRCN
jgi:photosystem II stability/assembly factor-like uncharacterized protein